MTLPPDYSSNDWHSGTEPARGFDCADAVAGGWTEEQISELMERGDPDELPFFDSAPTIVQQLAQFDGPGDEPRPGRTNKVTIDFREHELPEIVDKACRALVDADVELYARGTGLVRLVALGNRGNDKYGRERQATPILVPVDEPALTEILTDTLVWRKFNNSSKEWRPVAAPAVVAKTIIARRGKWAFPQLLSVVTAPTFRNDWSVVEERGFDSQSGIYFSSAVDWPGIPANPTMEDAKASLAKLIQLLSTFPFVNGGDRSCAIALILTSLARSALPTAPLFGVSAPTPASGKSKLVDIAATLATGNSAAVMSASREEPELQKTLSAALMAGDSFLSLDNVEHALRSAFLCQVLTQQTVKARVLGQSLNLDLPTAATICVTGNGLRFAGDLTRRVALISLDAGVERPQDRAFAFDAVELATEGRVEYVVAGITILRAFILSGAAAVSPKLGSFEVWSNVIRSALIWLGESDPLSNADRVRDDDPERERTSSIIRALPDGTWTASQISALVRSDLVNEAFQKHTALIEALGDFIERGKLDVTSFGMFLRKHRDRIVDGCRIVRVGELHRVALWCVERPEADASDDFVF